MENESGTRKSFQEQNYTEAEILKERGYSIHTIHVNPRNTGPTFMFEWVFRGTRAEGISQKPDIETTGTHIE